jgi:DNA (cytosine-5)-methyltransferase 1
MTYRVLDLFCGAGAVSEGLVASGFEVVGVDIARQRRYPYAFVQHDALKLDVRFLRYFDAIWASPPCQGYTDLRHAKGTKGAPKLIRPVREMLERACIPWVIENVDAPGVWAEMDDPIVLCGSHFGLGAVVGTQFYQLQRHRLFQASFPIPQPECAHKSPVIGVYGGHVRCRSLKHGGRGTVDFAGEDKPALAREAMGINHDMTMGEMSEAIPPAYAQHIARALRAHLQSRREAA